MVLWWGEWLNIGDNGVNILWEVVGVEGLVLVDVCVLLKVVLCFSFFKK